MSELIPISALVGDRTYRVKIDPKDEESVRKTLKIINDKIMEFKNLYAGKDMQDYISMVVIWYATERENLPIAGTEALTEQLNTLEKLIDTHLEP